MNCNCGNTNIYKDDLRIVRGNDFGIIYPIRPKYPDGSTVEGFDLNACTDLLIQIRRDGGSVKDVMTYAEGYVITGEKELRVNYDGLKLRIGSYRLDISGKFQGRDWRSYSKAEGFGIVESNEEANIPVGSFIADGVYTVVCDFLMTYQTQDQSDWNETDTLLPSFIKNKPTLPTSLGDLADDSEHRTVTDTEKESWDAKSDFSGNYEDLDNKPTIPAEQVQSDWEQTNQSAKDYIKNKPTIPEEVTVDSALSSTSENPVQNKVIKEALDGKVDKIHNMGLSSNDYTTAEKEKLAGLSNYDDTEVRGLINAKYTKPNTGIPASDLASGVIPDVSSFITSSVSNLTNYYLKSETYTKQEVANLIAAIQQFHFEIHASTSAISTPAGNVLYLVGPIGSGDDKYEEYVYANNTLTKIGDTSIDLSGYVTTTALNTALADYTTTANLNTLLAGYQAKIDSTHKLDYSLLSNTPTKVSDFNNDSGFITTETDPTVPSWAKQASKPSYSLSELGDDSTHRVVTDTEKAAWSGKQAALTFDSTPTSGSTNPVTSGGVYTATYNKVSSSDVTTMAKMSQVEYDALVTKDEHTLYIIV